MMAAFEKFCLICFRLKAEKRAEFTRVRDLHRKNLYHKLVSFDVLLVMETKFVFEEWTQCKGFGAAISFFHFLL